MKSKIGKRRELIYTFFLFLSCSLSSRSILDITLLNLLPAVAYGCSRLPADSETSDIATPVSITRSPENGIGSLDIFVFRDDPTCLLDCYMRVDNPDTWNHAVISSSGKRFISVCANSGIGMDEWPQIRSRHSLEEITFRLEEESRARPVMTGEARIMSDGQNGNGMLPRPAVVTLKPLTCEIVLRSLTCDFSGRPYDGEKLTDVKVYLTNVNAECGYADAADSKPRRIINTGFLNRHDLSEFHDSSLIISHIDKMIGKSRLQTDIHLHCYPNISEKEGPGTPVTRLVIEGKVAGDTYYWPIDINREQGKGVEGGRKYIFDVRITRKGTTDPDTAAETDDMTIRFEEEAWEEIEEYTVSF